MNTIELREIIGSDEKASICDNILNALPNWFGIPESIADYVNGVKGMPFFGTFSGEKCVGFVSILQHNKHTAEIYVMGILESYHGKGLGRRIVQTCEDFCRQRGIEFLTVKTLDEKNPDEYYRRTRLFYEAMGFKPLEVFPLLWDECNPCLFMVKNVPPQSRGVVRNHFTATGFVFNEAGQVLMIKHKKLKVWLPPGGHVDENELPCEAVVREVFEETGVKARVVPAFSDGDLPASEIGLPMPFDILLEDIEGDGMHNHIDLLYLCLAVAGAGDGLKPSEAEIDGIGWFYPAEVAGLETFDNVRGSVWKAERLITYME